MCTCSLVIGVVQTRFRKLWEKHSYYSCETAKNLLKTGSLALKPKQFCGQGTARTRCSAIALLIRDAQSSGAAGSKHNIWLLQSHYTRHKVFRFWFLQVLHDCKKTAVWSQEKSTPTVQPKVLPLPNIFVNYTRALLLSVRIWSKACIKILASKRWDFFSVLYKILMSRAASNKCRQFSSYTTRMCTPPLQLGIQSQCGL